MAVHLDQKHSDEGVATRMSAMQLQKDHIIESIESNYATKDLVPGAFVGGEKAPAAAGTRENKLGFVEMCNCLGNKNACGSWHKGEQTRISRNV